MKKLEITLSEVLEDMQKVYREQGKLTTRVYEEYGRWSVPRIRNIDTFNNLKKKALVDVPIHKNNISKEEIVADVLRVNGLLSKLTRDKYVELGKYSRKPIDRHFGSWNNLLKYLDLDINCLINIPEEELLTDLRRLYLKYGTISATTVKHYGRYSVEVYQRRFGSFNKSLEFSGIPTTLRGGISPTADSMIVNLENILGEQSEKEKTFSWLVNPKTGFNLYIDAYFKKENLAFEYDGPQHFSPVDAYGGEEGFKRRLELDSLKNELLIKNKVKLLRFPYHEPHTKEQIMKKLEYIL